MSDGRRLLANRYRLSEPLGRGGMADVYAAEDTNSGEMVAVKVMRIGESADPDRFESEMTVLDRLDHEAIVTLFDSGTTAEENPYFVMQLVPGQSLSARLRSHGPLDPAQVSAIGERVASALAHAHERGVVHRDIKPANILLDDDDAAFLTDFGVARLADATTVTRAGTTIGTAAYLAPEQLQDSAVGPGADVYSLGLVLMEALTGKRAFSGTGVEAAMARLTLDPVIPVLEGDWTPLLIGMTRRDAGRRLPASVVAAVLAGDQPAPSLDPDELETRTAPRVEGNDDPTAVTPAVGDPATPKPAAAGWAPPSTPPGQADPAALQPEAPGTSGEIPASAPAEPAAAATPPPEPAPAAPAVAAPAAAAAAAPPAAASPEAAADQPVAGTAAAAKPEAPVTPQPEAAPAPEPSSPPVEPSGDATPAADAPTTVSAGPQGTAAAHAASARGPVETGSVAGDAAGPRGFDAIRSRALLVGVLIGALLMVAVLGVTLLLSEPAGEDAPAEVPTALDIVPVMGTDPVDDATREVLRVLDASETLGTTSNNVVRLELRRRYGAIAVAVNADDWPTARMATADLVDAAEQAVVSTALDSVAVGPLVEALRDLSDAIRMAEIEDA